MSQENLEIGKKQLHASESQLFIQEQILKKLSREEEECLQVFRLENADSGHSYEWYKDRTEDRIDGTCEWFITHNNFLSWLGQDSGPLLVSADPGCGKSVLAKYLIDYKLPKSATVCYFFFKDQVQNTLKQALCALIHQLLCAKPSLVCYALPEHLTNGPGLVGIVPSLWKILSQAAQDPEAGSVIFVLDALDECKESDFLYLANMLRNEWLKETNGLGRVKWLLTSRPYEQITYEFQEIIDEFPCIRIPGEEESEKIGQEINHVIKYKVNRLAKRMKLSEDVRLHLETRLLAIPHRTYLWVYLVFDHLKKGFKKTKKGVENEIATLPESVNEAYEKILHRSSDERKARKALSIVLASLRPLTLAEMNVAVNIESSPPTECFGDLDLESEDDFTTTLRGWCGLFLSIYSGQVYLLHQTAREFLIKGLTQSKKALPQETVWANSFSIQQANRVLAETCLTYLKFRDLEERDGDHDRDGKKSNEFQVEEKPAFLQFSADNWAWHLKHANTDDMDLLAMAIEICDGRNKESQIWQRMIGARYGYWLSRPTMLLHFFCYVGIQEVARLLLRKGSNVRSRDSLGKTPLHIAASVGEDRVVALLIEQGAEINDRDDEGRTALHLAAERGQADTVALLLERGAEIDIQDVLRYTAICMAISSEDLCTVALLLEKGASVDMQDCTGHIPLHWAVGRDRTDLVALLLHSGSPVNARQYDGSTALHSAVRSGMIDIVSLLLENGAAIDLRGRNGHTAFHVAANYDRIEIAALLLEKGADIDAGDDQGSTALQMAAFCGQPYTVAFLLEKGAMLNSQDNEGRTPLDSAFQGSGRDQEGARKLLQEYGAKRREELALESLPELRTSLEELTPDAHSDTAQAVPTQAGIQPLRSL